MRGLMFVLLVAVVAVSYADPDEVLPHWFDMNPAAHRCKYPGADDRCLHGGYCISLYGQESCLCHPLFDGDRCEERKNWHSDGGEFDDFLCVDANREEECHEYKMNGLCTTKSLDCARTCGDCPPEGPQALSIDRTNDNECTNSVGRDDYCARWARLRACDTHPFYMRVNCEKACGTCAYKTPGACFDMYPTNLCSGWMLSGRCRANADWMSEGCAKTCGVCGDPRGFEEDARQYSRVGACEDIAHHDCAEPKAKGYCDTQSWMRAGCTKTCGLCPDDTCGGNW